MKQLLVSLARALGTSLSGAADRPYDPSADAKAQIQAALTEAAAARQPVLLIFGANWCADCRALDKSLHTGRNAELIAREFKVVKVDVGRFDHNVDIAQSYGVPLKKGIPAVVVLSPKNQVLYVTREGELADARKMGESGIYDFFRKVTPKLNTKS